MNFQNCFLVIISLIVCAFANINEFRKEALKNIEKNAAEVIEVGSKTNTRLNLKIPRVNQICFLIQSQADKIKTGNIEDVGNEAKLFYKKAEILDSKNSVYNCISNVANNGEIEIKKSYENFDRNLYYKNQEVENKQQLDIKNWKTDINAKEAEYRKKYSDANIAITQATQQTVIKTIVDNFQNLTNTFLNAILSIDNKLDSMHSDYLDNQQSAMVSLRTAMANSKTNTNNELKKCFTLKNFFILQTLND